MSGWKYLFSCGSIASTTALCALMALDAIARKPANAQVQLPELTVRAAKKPNVQPRPVARRLPPPPTVPPVSPAEIVAQRNNSFDQARSNLYTTVGTTSDTKSHETIEALPQGANAPVERVLLQAPGVSQDSAASGLFHVATIMPMPSIVLMAFFCRTASAVSAAFLILTLSAAYRW